VAENPGWQSRLALRHTRIGLTFLIFVLLFFRETNSLNRSVFPGPSCSRFTTWIGTADKHGPTL